MYRKSKAKIYDYNIQLLNGYYCWMCRSFDDYLLISNESFETIFWWRNQENIKKISTEIFNVHHSYPPKRKPNFWYEAKYKLKNLVPKHIN